MKKLFFILILMTVVNSLSARYYDPDMGRFANRDPLEYQDGMNLYGGYFAQHFGVDPSGTEFVYPVMDVKDVKKLIDEYNKAKNKNDRYPTDKEIESSKEQQEQTKKWIESVIEGKEGSKELQDYLKCLNKSKIKINISHHYTRQTSVNKKGDTTFYQMQGALTKGYGLVDNNEVNIDFNFKSKKLSHYTLVHEFLHIIEFSVVLQKEYEKKYDEKPLDCDCVEKIKNFVGKKEVWRITRTMHAYNGGFKRMVDKILQDHLKMKNEQ